MHDIQQLIADHERMDNLAAGLIDVARLPDPPLDDIYATIRELSACLDEHLAAEDGFLYCEHIQAAPDRLQSEVASFERDFRELTEEWSLYLHEWTQENIAADWRNFAHATLWIMRRLRARIAQENDILYPLALQAGRISLRAQPLRPHP